MEVARRLIGLEPSRAEIDTFVERKRARTVEETRKSLTQFYNKLETFDPKLRHLLDVIEMDPDHVLIGSGRADNAFILCPGVFERDDEGRNYRLKPNTRSIWLRQVTLVGGPFGLFLVPDTPEVRKAAQQAQAVIDEPSKQTTNSWGLRGPEPNLDADVRGLILGDSFMQGMFNGDEDTPPADLQRALSGYFEGSVGILNTGVLGYSPRQYFFASRSSVQGSNPISWWSVSARMISATRTRSWSGGVTTGTRRRTGWEKSISGAGRNRSPV